MVQKKKPSVGPGTYTIRGVVDGSIPVRVPEDSDPRLHARCADSATKSHPWPLPTSFPGPSMGVTTWIMVLTIQSTYFYRLGKQTSPNSIKGITTSDSQLICRVFSNPQPWVI